MPVPFRDLTGDDADLGLAGYLRFIEEADSRGVRGCLFCVNPRGEPIDFSFSRVDVPASFLWRTGDTKRRSVTALTKALFEACSKTPTLLLAKADEAPARVFEDDLTVRLPLCRVAGVDTDTHVATDAMESLSDAVHLFWVDGPPPTDSPARRLLKVLSSRGLATEPFERAAVGLDEVFSAS